MEAALDGEGLGVAAVFLFFFFDAFDTLVPVSISRWSSESRLLPPEVA